LSPLTATNAREPDGGTRMPSGIFPSGSRLTSLRVAASTTTSSPASRSEISANLPSDVNLIRFERLVPTLIVCVTFFEGTSMIETPPSRECALQSSRPSGDRSRPSGPLPTGITVWVQAPSRPCWSTETLSDAMFEVKIVRASWVGSTMCVEFCPVSNCQSILSVAGS
jgi:hypothetical protein